MPEVKQRRILQTHVSITVWKEGEHLEKYIVTRHFRCTQEESEEINRRAAKERKRVSAYLRDAALNRNIPQLDGNAVQLLKGLADNELKIGVNINQAVRICNTKKNVSRQDYENLTEMLTRIMEYRRKICELLIKLQGG